LFALNLFVLLHRQKKKQITRKKMIKNIINSKIRTVLYIAVAIVITVIAVLSCFIFFAIRTTNLLIIRMADRSIRQTGTEETFIIMTANSQ
jgi:hypothetical protein